MVVQKFVWENGQFSTFWKKHRNFPKRPIAMESCQNDFSIAFWFFFFKNPKIVDLRNNFCFCGIFLISEVQTCIHEYKVIYSKLHSFMERDYDQLDEWFVLDVNYQVLHWLLLLLLLLLLLCLFVLSGCYLLLSVDRTTTGRYWVNIGILRPKYMCFWTQLFVEHDLVIVCAFIWVDIIDYDGFIGISLFEDLYSGFWRYGHIFTWLKSVNYGENWKLE